MQGHSTVVFAGGGTGGHLFPGIAVAEELQVEEPRTEIIFAGSDRTVERQIVAARGYEHCTLPVEPSTTFRRHPYRSARNLWKSYAHARQLLSERRPDCVVGLGGFASVPVALAARRMRVPLVLLEQNVVPGRATTLLSRFASHVCLSFAETTGPIARRRNAIVTGNPVRREIAALYSDAVVGAPNSRRTLLVLGGSQGATAINDAVLAAARSSELSLGDWQIIHQTGPADVERVRGTYAELGLSVVVEAFFDDLVNWYRQATLAVSRAGATTLSELACSGCPALLVPYPHSLGDHQFANGRWFAERGAAEVVEQTEQPQKTATRVVERLSVLIGDVARRASMGKAMRAVARPNAARERRRACGDNFADGVKILFLKPRAMLRVMLQRSPYSVRILRYLLRFGLQLLVFLALYVLSIGPMFWYWFGAFYADGPKVFFLIYFPLLWVCDRNETIRDVVNTYINWWITS